jgi:hypothetical protein
MSQFFHSKASSASTAELITPEEVGPITLEEVGLSGTPSHSSPRPSHPSTAAAAPRAVQRSTPGTRWTTTDVC